METAQKNVPAEAMNQAKALTERYADMQVMQENGKVNLTFTDSTTGVDIDPKFTAGVSNINLIATKLVSS